MVSSSFSTSLHERDFANFRDLVFARQDVSDDLSLPKLPKLPDVGPLVDGFLSGLEAATPAAPPATSSAVSARSAPTDGKFLFLDLVAREGLCQLP
jgi:hypothetical protein